jgi:phosphonate transport system permease protein
MLAALVLLWPLVVATEFKPWILLEPDNLKVTGQFLGSFCRRRMIGRLPGPGGARDLAHRGHRHRRHVLALVLAVPLTLLSRACCRSRRCRGAWRAGRSGCARRCAGC